MSDQKTKTVFVVQSVDRDLEGNNLWEDDYTHDATDPGALLKARRDTLGYHDRYSVRIIKRTEEVVG